MIKYDDSYNQNRIISGLAVNSEKFENLKEPVYCTQMHYHKDFEIFYVLEGSAEFHVAGKKYFISKDSLVLINPYEAHYGIIKSNNFDYFCINFDFSYLNHNLEQKIINGELTYNNHFENAESLLPFLTDCYKSIVAEKDGWIMRSIGNLMIFFSFLDDFISQSENSKDHNFVKRILSILDEHYSENINTESMAKAFAYDKSYFCRKFKKAFSCGFSFYLKNYRISKAKEIILHKNASQTAIETGFSGVNYFTKTFKEITGMTPSEYKKLNS